MLEGICRTNVDLGGKHCLHGRFQCFRRGFRLRFYSRRSLPRLTEFVNGNERSRIEVTTASLTRIADECHRTLADSPNTGKPREKEPRVIIPRNEIPERATFHCLGKHTVHAQYFSNNRCFAKLHIAGEREREKRGTFQGVFMFAM